MTLKTQEYLYSTMVNNVVAYLEEGFARGAAALFEEQVARYSFSRVTAIAAIRSKLFRTHGTSHDKYMAAFNAGISIVRGRAA